MSFRAFAAPSLDLSKAQLGRAVFPVGPHHGESGQALVLLAGISILWFQGSHLFPLLKADGPFQTDTTR